MATRRAPPERPQQRDAEGKRLCRMCQGPVKPPKRSWCSPECVAKRWEELDPRAAVQKRDKGVCAECGLDVPQLEKAAWRALRLIEALRWARQDEVGGSRGGMVNYWKRIPAKSLLARWVARRVGRAVGRISMGRSWWEADHIVPLVEGGGHTLDNFRTLCLWCHRDATKALAGRRAEGRRK